MTATKTSPTAIESGQWLRRPGGLFVSGKRLYRGDTFLSLDYLSRMNGAEINAFNQGVGQYDVCIEPTDPPIDRLVKVCVYLSRRDKDGSHMFTKTGHDSMLVDVARHKNQKPMDAFYRLLRKTTPPQWDVTSDVLKFLDEQKWGMRQALLFQFNEDGRLVPVDEIKIMVKNGCIRILGTRGYPMDVSKEQCSIENLVDTPLQGLDVEGYVYFGENPLAKNEEWITRCGPDWSGKRLFDFSVSVGRSYSYEFVGTLRERGMLTGL